MTTRSPLAICPVVAEMTAGGSFNLDDLAAHVKGCPTCQAITGALMKPIADVLTAWPPEPPAKDERGEDA